MKAHTIARGMAVLAALGTLAIIVVGLFHPATPVEPVVAGSTRVGLEQGDAAPNFTLKMLNGRTVSLSDYRGTPVLLNFWEINCVGCQAEMPGLQKEYASLQSQHRGFVVLGVDVGDDPALVRQFVQRRGFTYPVAVDGAASVQGLYDLRATPTCYFFVQRGVIRAVSEGAMDEATLHAQVTQLDV